MNPCGTDHPGTCLPCECHCDRNRSPQDLARVANYRRSVAAENIDIDTTPSVGVIGVVCGAETNARVVRKTTHGPLHRAVCNRWAHHDGPHTMTRGKDFAKLHTWTDAQCRMRTANELKTQELAISARLARP